MLDRNLVMKKTEIADNNAASPPKLDTYVKQHTI